jgi:hypothetical protein
VARRLLDQGRLTAAGTRFVTALHDEVSPWLTEGGAGDSDRCSEQRLAEVANLDHYLRWRLRNMAVDLAAGTSRLVPAPRRALESSARLDLIHRSLSGNNAGGRATAGDAALLRGHHGTARRAYQEMILNDPGDDTAWTGLAIVTGRTDRLELVVGAYRARDDRPDPLAWISGQHFLGRAG